jgi:hypothetical protein
MGDFRFRSLLFQFLEALTKPVQPFSLRKRRVRTRSHTCTDSAHGMPNFTVGAPQGSDFPAALVRFCHALGVAVLLCDPHHPQQNGFVMV